MTKTNTWRWVSTLTFFLRVALVRRWLQVLSIFTTVLCELMVGVWLLLSSSGAFSSTELPGNYIVRLNWLGKSNPSTLVCNKSLVRHVVDSVQHKFSHINHVFSEEWLQYRFWIGFIFKKISMITRLATFQVYNEHHSWIPSLRINCRPRYFSEYKPRDPIFLDSPFSLQSISFSFRQPDTPDIPIRDTNQRHHKPTSWVWLF